MKLFFDFFPIVLFFIGYKIFDIYYATAIAMAASFIQVIFYRLKYQRYEQMHLISLLIIVVLGGATLFFHNPWFIKCKPTGIYWLMSILLICSPLFFKKTLIQKIMESNINLPAIIWSRLNYTWALFFAVMGGVNLYVAYFYSTDIWVNFKLFGCMGFTLLFVLLQAFYLTRHIIDTDVDQQTTRAPRNLP